MTFFAIFTLAAALSPNFIALVIARAFQGTGHCFATMVKYHSLTGASPIGIGGAFTIPPAQAHISLYFPEPKKRVKATAAWGMFATLGVMCAINNHPLLLRKPFR
jgi:MFS family permease